jgi:hypothetical protein
LIGNYHFARDYGCVHPGMPSGRKHPRRNRDAPIHPTRPLVAALGSEPRFTEPRRLETPLNGGLALKELLPI